jgi:molybdate transport system substrate-binding protein
MDRCRKTAILGRALAVALALAVLSGCGKSDRPPAGPERGAATGSPTPAEAFVVSAAASTKDVLEALSEQFKNRSDATIRLNTGPSSGLANQIIAGAPADLFLSANVQWADAVQQAGLAARSVRLLTNRLVIVVPESNPGGVQDPQDLLSPKVRHIALAGEKVPAGLYADQALTKLNLSEPLARDGKIVRGQDVRVALSYVERGEADAGIVYSTDVRAATGVRIVHEFDPALHDEIVYVLVRLKGSAPNSAADELFRFLQSPEAEEIYAKFGFSRLPVDAPVNPGDADAFDFHW